MGSSRRLTVAAFDFIQDYTDRRWKFLNLKYFYTENPNGNMSSDDGDAYLLRSIISQGKPPTGHAENRILLSPKAGETKCNGDYCHLPLINQNGNIPFAYLRDTVRVLQFQQMILEYDFSLSLKRYGLGEENIVARKRSVKGTPMHDVGSADYYNVMRKVINLDRQRKRAIQEGSLQDEELFAKEVKVTQPPSPRAPQQGGPLQYTVERVNKL